MSYFVCYHLYMKTTLFGEERYDFSIIDYLLFLVGRLITLAALDSVISL